MAEELSRYDFATLTRSQTQRFIQNPIDPQVLSATEEAIQAYIPLDPETFAGFLYHPQGLGPETPYFFPKEEDLNHLVQAASRIGVRRRYWQFVYETQRDGTIHPFYWNSTAMFAINMQPDGSGEIEKYKPDEYRKERLDKIANAHGDKIPKYDTFAPLISYGGDADFYGAYKPRIFPMAKVQAGDLGINIEDAILTWESWKNIFAARDHVFLHALEALLFENKNEDQALQLATWCVEMIKANPKGLTIASDGHFFRLPDDGVSISHWQVYDFLFNSINLAMSEGRFNSSLLVKTLAVHVDDLANMYEKAKRHLESAYKYE